ncbi:hypothetical protein ABZZ17_19435 [Streptomyces sp. NPDC006512]|uniref:hypothetical protein n=1 Tax=Streptomyces sp. NPDC006512 TaxID=3154307 RepID=UPI0033B9C614
MGKRERRRKREQAKRKQQRPGTTPASVVFDFPAEGPRLRAVIKPGLDPQVQELARLYWEINEAGKWARTVSSIGDSQWVASTATGASYAVLLGSLCLHCDEPLRVTNRSWAAKVAGTYLDRKNEKYICSDCSAIQEAEAALQREREAEKARVAKEIADAKQAEDRRRLTETLAREEAKDGTDYAVPYRNKAALAFYVALTGYATTAAPGKPLPSISDIGTLAWTGDPQRDADMLSELYACGLLALDPSTPATAFSTSAEDEVTFDLGCARWRMAGGIGTTKTVSQSLSAILRTRPGPEAHEYRSALQHLVEEMEMLDVVAYLDGLLVKKYNYPAVPEARREELTEIVRGGFDAGYTSGQMFCFAWRAADSAAAWKERSGPKIGPPEAASASVTSLGGKIAKAIELRHSIPEYDPPRWHATPVALGALRKVNADVRRVYDRTVMGACDQCDENGITLESRDDGHGRSTVARCVHPKDIPSQREEEALFWSDDEPEDEPVDC